MDNTAVRNLKLGFTNNEYRDFLNAIYEVGGVAEELKQLARESQGLEAYALNALAQKLDKQHGLLVLGSSIMKMSTPR